MANYWKQKLNQKVKKYLKGYSGCHDYYHSERVKKYALEIAGKIKCDKDVIFAGAILHDIGYKGKEDDDKNHNLHGAKIAERWLKEVGFAEEKIKDVLEIIRLHDNYSWSDRYEPTEHTETKVIQDADRIDALGAIGVARISYYFGERGYPIYNPAPVKETKNVWLDHSLLDQIKRDSLKKWENFNFEISRKISKRRHKIVKDFYSELKKELEDAHLN